MHPSEVNRLFDLTKKQMTVALSAAELKELLRLTRKRAKQTEDMNQRDVEPKVNPADTSFENQIRTLPPER